MSLGVYFLCWLVAFLCGSIPFAVLIGKTQGVDIRTIGSGNPGATNLGRAVGKKWGLLCFLLDVGKGLVPVLAFGGVLLIADLRHDFNPNLASDFLPTTTGIGWALQWVGLAAAAVLGHVFSPWLSFKGGKGVATSLGAALGLFPFVTVPGVVCGLTWVTVAKTTGYVGLASICAALLLPVLTLFCTLGFGLGIGPVAVFVGFTTLLAALVIWRHRGNLARLRAGTEPKAKWTGKGQSDKEKVTSEK